MKVLSLFSGIGAFEKALENLNIDFDLINYCEIDKFASHAYSAIHNVSEDKNLWDVSKIETKDLKDFDILTWGFPCQDVSIAGNQKGIKVGTRSGLYYEGYRILKDKLPKYSIIENVKNLTSKKFKDTLDFILKDLSDLGYRNYLEVLNAKNFGVPQNRDRVFIVSILGDDYFEFPEGEELGIRLYDILEDSVDEKYYISEDRVKNLLLTNNMQQKSFPKNKEIKIAKALNSREYRNSGWKNISPTLKARGYKDPNVVAIPCLTPDRLIKRQNGRRFKTNGEPMFTLTSQDRHGVVVREATKKGFAIAREGDSINISQPNSKTRRGRVGKQVANTLLTGIEQCVVEPIRLGGLFDKEGERHQAGSIWDKEAISPTLDTMQGGYRQPTIIESKKEFGRMGKQAAETFNENKSGFGDTINPFNKVLLKNGVSPTITTRPDGFKTAIIPVTKDFRIRKLTPLECWRLMGFEDEDFYKAQKALNKKFYNGRNKANSRLYKMAGNSIVVNVLEAIFKELLVKKRKPQQEELF